MATRIKAGETVLFVGDSITDCGRRAAERPLGSGYVKFFADFMAIREPAKKITIINKGIGGNTVIDLQNRWTDDVLRHKPNWLSIKIGINDVHRTLRNTEDAVPVERFTKAYDEILSRTVKKLPRVKLLLIDPFYMSRETSTESFRHTVLRELPRYIAAVHRLSRRYKTRLVKTHDLFQNLLKYREPDFCCNEPVHPNQSGHLLIAEAVYNQLGR